MEPLAPRRLRFASLDEVTAELDRLAAGPHRQAGRWSLDQTCDHLTGAIGASIDGADRLPWWFAVAVGATRPFARPFVFRMIRNGGPMPRGMKSPPQFAPAETPPPGATDRLRAALARLEAHGDGPFAPSPLLGKLTPDQWRRLHLIHAAHHFGFLHPAGDAK